MKLRLPATLAAFAALGLAASARADAPRVAADILPVHSLVARVMEGVGTPDLILGPGASPHSHAMRPSEAAALDAADVVFWVGEELTPWMQEPLQSLAGDARTVSLLDSEGTVRLHYRGAGEPGPEEAGHDHEGSDPHAWLDPANGRTWLAVIADNLADLDPGNASLYRANAAAGVAEIDATERKIRDQLAAAGQIGYAVFHDAYQYFDVRFGLEPAFSISLGDASAPGPRRIAELRASIDGADIGCVLAEPGASEGLVATVFEGHDVETRVIDPAGSGLNPGPKLYVALLDELGSVLAGCAAIAE